MLLVDDQLKFQAQSLGCLTAHGHTAEENLEIVHDRAVVGINGELQLDDGALLIDFKQGLLDGVLPKLIPLLITLGIYVLIKKGWTPVKCIILILVAVSALFCSSERTIPITNVTRNG